MQRDSNGNLIEIDLGPLPSDERMSPGEFRGSFTYVYAGQTYLNCYAEFEEDDARMTGWWGALRYAAFAVSGSVVCWLIFTLIHWLGAL
jgi:hypothetical protein